MTDRSLVSVAAAAGVRLEAVDGRRVIVSGGAGRMVPVWDARSGNHRRIEVDAKAHGIVTTEELIVVPTALAWQPSGSRRPPLQQSSTSGSGEITGRVPNAFPQSV